MSIKTPLQVALKTMPTWEGERLDRTSMERILCHRCSNLATHRCLVRGGNSVKDMWFCASCISNAINEHDVTRVREVKSWRLYKSRLAKWNDAKEFAATQTTLL